MLSMTGYGRGEYKEGGIELTAEVKSVNNRYLDVSVKCPRIFIAFEDVIRAEVRSMLTRGHADVFIGLSDKREKKRELYLDENIAQAYVRAGGRIKELFPDIPSDVTVTSVLRKAQRGYAFENGRNRKARRRSRKARASRRGKLQG